jgi:glycosyltransferase involved in cell wall biosynthesis
METLQQLTDAPLFLRAHNVEDIIWERLASHTGNPVLKQYLLFLAKRLKRYETAMINRFDGIIAISDADSRFLRDVGCKVPVHIAPVSVDAEKYQMTNRDASTLTAFHLGSMDWLPNQEGIQWFMENVFPLLQDMKGLKIVLAGKGMPDEFYKMAGGNLEVMGKVDDARKFMSDKQMMLVPLLSGGGMRVKIIEGLAAGKTVISTATGAEGIRISDGENILIADEPHKFAAMIRKCVGDHEFCFSVGSRARALINSVYDNKVVGESVFSFIKSFLKTATLHS